MSGVFFTSPLTRTATQGGTWAKVDAYFPELQVFANVLVLRNLTVSPATIAASDVRSTAGTARLSYVVPTTGFYELIATSYDTGVTGSYTLTIP